MLMLCAALGGRGDYGVLSFWVFTFVVCVLCKFDEGSGRSLVSVHEKGDETFWAEGGSTRVAEKRTIAII